ncbi:protein NRT1/ PTR FAMILY 4.6-like isoform X2 [Silene latifolia]|uniref:protein NRT1/ PTR FAMILY 4.6-like isoform X2 n=1 Tax=Silene latifolia TaxID=37657 RepID=UPI003D776A46
MDEAQMVSKWEGYVDWRNRPALKGRHGGILAAFFVLVVEVMENLAYLANASNLVLYMSKDMNYSPSRSAIIVTNFMGTAFLLALLGGFLSDAFFTTYHIFLISAVIEFLGLLVLTIQAQIPALEPPHCSPTATNKGCGEVAGGKAAALFIGLYLVALGVGGIKGSLPPHGAEQFDENSADGRKKRSSFFNYYVFCLSFGALIAVTFVVWIEDNLGWQWGFGVSTLTILLSIPIFLLGSSTYRIKVPAGSPITTIFKVLVAAICNKLFPRKPSNAIMSMETSPSTTTETQDLKFLNKAITSNPSHRQLECSTNQVEEVKIVLKTIPIFASTIMLNCCLAQLSTFSIQQAATMNTTLGSFTVPPASLPVFPVVFILILAPVYDHLVLPFARRVTRSEMGITHLQRIGFGLVMSIVAMAVAAIVEVKRKRVAIQHGLMESTDPLPITFLWIAIQYLFLGSADLFSLAGLLEFFFTEAPTSMRSLATSFSWASLAVGYYMNSVLVSVVNRVTGLSGHTPWLIGPNLNHYRLDRFYWVMCVLSGLNFLNYLFWARRYKYRSSN